MRMTNWMSSLGSLLISTLSGLVVLVLVARCLADQCSPIQVIFSGPPPDLYSSDANPYVWLDGPPPFDCDDRFFAFRMAFDWAAYLLIFGLTGALAARIGGGLPKVRSALAGGFIACLFFFASANEYGPGIFQSEKILAFYLVLAGASTVAAWIGGSIAVRHAELQNRWQKN